MEDLVVHKTQFDEGGDITHTCRGFLNAPGHHTIGLYFLEAVFSRWNGHKLGELDLTIGDCNRQITLSLDCNDEAETANSIEKLDRLIKVAKLARKYLKGKVEP